jgi:hypothetical protein
MDALMETYLAPYLEVSKALMMEFWMVVLMESRMDVLMDFWMDILMAADLEIVRATVMVEMSEQGWVLDLDVQMDALMETYLVLY